MIEVSRFFCTGSTDVQIAEKVLNDVMATNADKIKSA